MIKAVLFDIDNTLLSFDEYVKAAMKSGFEEFGLCKYEDYMFSEFTKTNSELWHSLERGELSFEELKRIRWNLIFEKMGISADGVAFEKYFRSFLYSSAILIENAEEILQYLFGKYILCAASNGPFLQQENRLRVGNLLQYFSHLFISEEIGFSKPAKEFFDICIERLNSGSDENIQPDEILIVGDSLSSDMAGGIQSGIKTCFYNPDSKPIPQEMNIDYSIKSLCEIKEIL